ncbi:MAG: Uncharacterised protein [Rhodospirillaceae bacterium]|nr:MAG: Uncharacterised protein [Rhodospirillaceae bacterium]
MPQLSRVRCMGIGYMGAKYKTSKYKTGKYKTGKYLITSLSPPSYCHPENGDKF